MSDRLRQTKSESNEEIIEDLTRSLKDALQSEEKVTKEGAELVDKDFIIEEDRNAESMPPVDGQATFDISHDTERDFETIELNDDDEDEQQDISQGSKVDDKDADDDADSIDETQLKDEEMHLTDDQKAERKIVAEELKVAGNNAFKDGEYERSAEKYTEGLKICPLQFTQQRAILYCNRSAAKMKMEKYKQAIRDCTKAIELDDRYLKAYNRIDQNPFLADAYVITSTCMPNFSPIHPVVWAVR
ncbi:hypothetical protein evm_008994 [Chilo suppressalis]|nr:hypothetical protein evm_008994 [Chilo suppressalis]